MGFPVGCTVIILPNILIQALSILGFIRSLILSLPSLLGSISDFLQPDVVRVDPLGSPSRSYSTRPGSVPVPVPVSMIREMLPVVKFSEIVAGAGGDETPESCAVCLLDFEAEEEIRRLRNCRHVFHRLCVDRWMDHDQRTCPLCRTPFILPEMQDQGSVVESLWADVYGDYLPIPTTFV